MVTRLGAYALATFLQFGMAILLHSPGVILLHPMPIKKNV
jgi:hypothetical protein